MIGAGRAVSWVGLSRASLTVIFFLVARIRKETEIGLVGRTPPSLFLADGWIGYNVQGRTGQED